MSINPMAVIQNEVARLKSENDQLKQDLQQMREFVEILHELNTKPPVQSDAELLPMLRGIFLKMLSLINAPDGSLALLDEETNELVFVLVHGTLAADLSGFRFPAGDGIAGWVVKNAQPALVRDVRRDHRFSALIDDAFKFRTQSIAAAPLIGDLKVYGIIEALNQPGDEPFSETDLAFLGLLCRAAGERLADIERSRTS
ncbi:MAG: GAF domain-containing protein [Chitinophagaceae bacterium]|nr:GAF domain-containing protein [Anaerolineae bacterium]